MEMLLLDGFEEHDVEDDWFEDDLDEDIEDDELDDVIDLEDSLRAALGEGYAAIGADELADTMDDLLESLTPAESLNLGKALSQIGKGAAQAFEDPTVRQI